MANPYAASLIPFKSAPPAFRLPKPSPPPALIASASPPRPPPPSAVIPSTPAPSPVFRLKLAFSDPSTQPFVPPKPTTPPRFSLPAASIEEKGRRLHLVRHKLVEEGWITIPESPLFGKTFKLKGADFRSGVMSRLASYLKLWPSFPSDLISSLSLSTSSASLSITLNPSVAPSSANTLLRLIDRAIDLEEEDKAGKWYATGNQQRELKQLGWKRVWRVKADGWVKEGGGERERERVLERTFDFTGKEDAWKLMRKTSGRLHRVLVDVGWRSRMMGISEESKFDLLIFPLPPMDLPPLLTVQLSPLQSSPPLSPLAGATKLHPFPRLPYHLRVAALSTENIVAAQNLGTPEETAASRSRLQKEIADRLAREDSPVESTRWVTDDEQRELREAGWRRVWREKKEVNGEGEGEREKETALQRTFGFEGQENEWDLVEKAKIRLDSLFWDPDFRRSMGMSHEPNFSLTILPLPSPSSTSSPRITIQLTPHRTSPPLSLLTPLSSSTKLLHRLPVALLSAAKIIQHVIQNTRLGTAAQYSERREREFGLLTDEENPDFWTGTRDSAVEVVEKLVGELGELETYRPREFKKVAESTPTAAESDTFEADFLSSAFASSSSSSSPLSPPSSSFPSSSSLWSPITPRHPSSNTRTDLSSLLQPRSSSPSSSSSFNNSPSSSSHPFEPSTGSNNPFRSNWIPSTPPLPFTRPNLPPSDEFGLEDEEDLLGLVGEELDGLEGGGKKGGEKMDAEREMRQLMNLVMKGGKGMR